jgi:hypothetical protein
MDAGHLEEALHAMHAVQGLGAVAQCARSRWAPKRSLTQAQSGHRLRLDRASRAARFGDAPENDGPATRNVLRFLQAPFRAGGAQPPRPQSKLSAGDAESGQVTGGQVPSQFMRHAAWSSRLSRRQIAP